MCRLIEIRSALDPRFSTFESQKALLLKKNIFRPRSFCSPPPLFSLTHKELQTNHHFQDTSAVESRLRIGYYVYDYQGLILIINKILE